MPPICSPIVRPGRPAEAAPVISKQLSDTISRQVKSFLCYPFLVQLIFPWLCAEMCVLPRPRLLASLCWIKTSVSLLKSTCPVCFYWIHILFSNIPSLTHIVCHWLITALAWLIWRNCPWSVEKLPGWRTWLVVLVFHCLLSSHLASKLRQSLPIFSFLISQNQKCF